MSIKYTAVAATPDAWMCAILTRSTFEEVHTKLIDLARSGWPASAFLSGGAPYPVSQVLLYRDPSRTHGTPRIAECVTAARALAAATEGLILPGHGPKGRIVVGLGLREGYAADAPQHDPSEVSRMLAAYGEVRCRNTRVVSARLVDGKMLWHDEPGVLIQTSLAMIPAILAVAAALNQDRFVITDLKMGCTIAVKKNVGVRPSSILT